MSGEAPRFAVEVAGVRVAYDGSPVLDGLTLRVVRGEWLGIIGPNGSGKTTLLRAIGGHLRAAAGEVLLEGRPLGRYRPEERARLLTAVGAEMPSDFGFTVTEFVMLGRIPHARAWAVEGEADWREVDDALRRTATRHLAGRPLSRLSAGERQRVQLARAVAQRAHVLLLDEPTAHLDVRHRLEAMELLEALRRDEGVTLVTVLHDLNLAALYCRRLVLMAGGRIRAAGSARDVLRPDLLSEVYGCDVCVTEHPRLGVPQVLPQPGATRRPEAAG